MDRLRVYQVVAFALGWIAYASTYFLRKPLGVIKADLERELTLSKSALGWLDTALLLPYAVMQMLLGPLGDKFGARQTFGCCLILSAISMITFGYWSNLYMFCFLLFINGTAQAQCWPNCTKALLSWFSDEVRNSVFGMFGTCAFAGGIMGTMFAVYLQSKLGWRSVYIWPSLFVLIVGFLVLLFFRTPEEANIKITGKEEAQSRGTSQKTSEVLSIWELWKIPMLKEVAIGVFCLKVVRYCMYMWLPMYLLQELKYPQHLAGILSTTFEIGGVLGSALSGFVLDRYFQGRSLLGTGVSTALSSAALVLFALTGSWGMLFNCLFLFVAGAFNAGPDVLLGGSIPAELGEQNGRNAAAATVGLVNGFGSVGTCIEGPLIGVISSYYGWGSMFYLMTGLSLAGALSVFRAASLYSRRPHPVTEITIA